MSSRADPNYLDDDRAFQEPKEIFKQLLSLVSAERGDDAISLLDVGCAAGAFLFHATRSLRLDARSTVGLDPAELLLVEARRRLPDLEFVRGSIDDNAVLSGRRFDVCTAMGVMSLFQDIEAPLRNLVRLTRPGGMILVFDTVNDDPVDVLVSYRRADVADAPWESGLNVRSRFTYETLLAKVAPEAEVEFTPFRMPFAIPKGDDPLRSWTIGTADDPNQLVVGTRQLLTSSIVRIRIR
jgi:ubiquinone/menaquinone biosynthesis C-methylase UbiE